ncbi:acetyltransferase [Novosphingobium terrae]|uniref:acetyltransferase n=1 Tax=Novosphingobium terrae TaxID=2726189 RepID=UPI00237A49A3|nr:acetyltransferase [Novosphingobium terrae]
MSLIIVASSSGQHAAVVYEAAILAGMAVEGLATIEHDAPSAILDCKFLGDVDEVISSASHRRAQFVIACGSNMVRRHWCERILALGVELGTVCHPAAIISPSAAIAPGSTLLAGAIVGPRASVGYGVIVNHASTVDHDCRIGDYVNISPGARLAGCVQLENGVFVGMNASIIQSIRLGENAIVGAGAVVTRDVAPEATVVGVPAHPISSRKNAD